MPPEPRADAPLTFDAPTSRWRFAMLVWLCWTVPGIITTTIGLTVGSSPNEEYPVFPILASQLSVWWYWAAATPAVWWLGRKFPLERNGPGSSWPLHAVFAIVAALLYAISNALIMRVAFPESATEGPFWQWFRTYLPSRVPVGVLLYFALLGIGAAIDSRRRLRQRELQTLQLSAQLARAQVQALQTQLQPHFLFNTLHAVGMLVHEDATAAGRMLTKLGDLLRQTLALTDVPEIALREELSILDDYLGIERVRFGDRLSVEIDVDQSLLSAAVPTFVLQPLVENAVRYGVTSRVGPGRIRISARRTGDTMQLIVQDDGPESGSAAAAHATPHIADAPTPIVAARESRNGVGLGSTRARLVALYPADAASLELTKLPNGGTTAVLSLPLRDLND